MVVMMVEVYMAMHIIIYVLFRIIVIFVIYAGPWRCWWVWVVVTVRRPGFRVCDTTAEYSASEYDYAHCLK
jgi:hypothetical protein